MAKKMSEILEGKVGGVLRVRTLLTLLLCVVNFVLTYGVCLYYLMGGGPVLMWISVVLTVVLVLTLAFPNLEVQQDTEAKDVVD